VADDIRSQVELLAANFIQQQQAEIAMLRAAGDSLAARLMFWAGASMDKGDPDSFVLSAWEEARRD
jgi:hypothetical protein